MANHAYVVTPVKPTVAQVDAIVRRVVSEKFPMLVVETHPDTEEAYWQVTHPKDTAYLVLDFWFGDHRLDKDELARIPHVVLDEEDDGMTNVFAIEFRHGHSYEMLWWIEHEIREAVGRELDGCMFDDGVGIMGEPDPDTYATYMEYRRRRGWTTGDCVAELLRHEKASLPKDMREIYG